MVIVNGRAIKVDLSGMPTNIHAVQFNGANGHVEYTDKAAVDIQDLTEFQVWLDGWQAAADAEDAPPPPPTPEKVAAEKKRQIESVRDAKLAEGALYNGKRWHMDDVMRAALQWRLFRWQVGDLAADARLPVRAIDNTTTLLGKDEHMALAKAIEEQGGAIYAESWAAKDKP